MQSMNLQSGPKTDEIGGILKEMRSMKESLGEALSAKSERTHSEYSAIVENMRKMTQRHNEVARIVTTLPSSVQSLQTENSKMCKEIASMNASHLTISKLVVPPSPSPPSTTSSAPNEATVQMMKAMISRQIEEMKRQFVRSDGALKANLDKMLQHINSGNVSLFNNMKTLHGAQRQHIVDECGARTKSAIDAHQSVLKEHLLAIQKGLKQFNQTQLTLNQAISTGMTPQKPSVPPLSLSSASTPRAKPLDFSGILPRIQQIVGQKVTESNGSLMQHISKLAAQRRPEPAPKEAEEVQCGGGEAVKEMMAYIRCNVMREVQLIKNLCNDIHKKSEQLPHVVARNSDLRKFEHKFLEFAAASSHREVARGGGGGDGGHEAADRFLTVLMMPLSVWSENVMAQISRNRHECSQYVVVYVLSQIAFSSFAYRSGDDDDEKMAERTTTNLAQIQSSALAMLGRIESKICDDEVEGEELVDDLMESMRAILSGDGNADHIWISRAGHSMSHLCHSELQRDRKLSAMEEILERVLRKQSNTCMNMAVCQPLILCSSVFVLLFGVWLQSIWTEQNIHH